MENVNNTSKSTIVDIPLQPNQEDLLNLEGFQKALIEYIRNSDSPISIALQGERGTGKTSVMNAIKEELCDKKSYAPFHGIWINTWQFSLLNDPPQAIINILLVIVNQIGALNPDSQHYQNVIHLIGRIGVVAKFAYDVFGGFVLNQDMKNIADKSTNFVKNLWNKHFAKNQHDKYKNLDKSSAVEQIRKEIICLVNEILDSNKAFNKKQGFLFFIDDLDRVDPGFAVDVLELFKNIFDFKSCIFVLAIDSKIVIKGLKLKSSSNKYLFQSDQDYLLYFEKLIQMQVAMPVSYYAIYNFIEKSLKLIKYFSESELNKNNRGLLILLGDAAKWSIGSNPRALKRLINTLSLLDHLSRFSWHNLGIGFDREGALSTIDKTLVYLLLCIQIAYPTLYQLLLKKSNFLCWNASFDFNINDPNVDVSSLQLIKFENEIGDCSTKPEDWEIALFRICNRDDYLKQRFIDILRLFYSIIKYFEEAFKYKANNDNDIAALFDGAEHYMNYQLDFFLPRLVVNNIL